MSVMMVNQVVETALGGMNLIKTVEGRERYPVRVRYRRRPTRADRPARPAAVVTHSGEVVPLEELATLETTWGPGAINSENARLVAHVAFASSGATGDLESVAAIEKSLRAAMAAPAGSPERLELPPGYSLETVGSFRNQIEANRPPRLAGAAGGRHHLLVIYLQFRHVADHAGGLRRHPGGVRRWDDRPRPFRRRDEHGRLGRFQSLCSGSRGTTAS